MINENQKIINTKVLYIALILNIISYIILYLLDDFRSQIINYFLTLLPAYLAYFLIVYYSLKLKTSANKDLIFLLIIGFLIRMILIPSNPILSDDIYRYLWDGKVFYDGFNPFAYPPASPVLEGLRDSTIYPKINYPGIPTVYPPFSQIIFAVSYIIGYNIIVWKLVLFVFEGILVFFLYKLIIHFKMNTMRLSIYLINPLVVIETYSSGHLDIIAVCLFMIGIYYFYKKKSVVSILAFILSILSKYNPLLMILPLLKKRFLLKISILFGSIITVLFPFVLSGTIPTAGFISFTNRWEFNGFLYKSFLFIYDLLEFQSQKWFSLAYNGHTEEFYITGAFYYKILVFIILIFIVIDQLKKLKMTEDFKGINYLQPVLFIGTAMLLLSPTLYPWYLVWIIPLLVFLPNWSWLIFTMLIQLSYFVLQDYANYGIWEESNLILWLQYLPFYGLLIFEYLDKRKIKGWFL
jgi:alpha-1,6-mannosyltransferase